MFGIGHGFRNVLSFSSRKSEMNLADPSFLGMIKVGISTSVKLCTPVLTNGTSNQHACSAERPSIGKMQHPKGCCVELGNGSIKNQLGSTNSKGSPVLFQGSHHGFFLTDQLIHYDGSHRHAHCHPLHVTKPNK